MTSDEWKSPVTLQSSLNLMALPEKIHLVVVTPERQLFSGLVGRVTLPSNQGELGILPGHAPLLAELGIGEISYHVGDAMESFFCSWGFAEVLPDRVVLLAQTAEPASEIDLNRAEQAKSRAEKRLGSKDPNLDFARAELALLRALSRLNVARHLRATKSRIQ